MKKYLIMITSFTALSLQAVWVGGIQLPDDYDEDAALRAALESSEQAAHTANSSRASIASGASGSSATSNDTSSLSEQEQLELALNLSLSGLKGTTQNDDDQDEPVFVRRRSTLRSAPDAQARDQIRRTSRIDQLSRHGSREEARILEESSFLHTINKFKQKAEVASSESRIDAEQAQRRQASVSSEVSCELATLLARRLKINEEKI